MDSLLSLQYVPISEATLFDKNVKKHDLGKIADSLRKYGFKSAIKWESKLNSGAGGVVAGNGRVEALLWMQHNGEKPPKGIAINDSGNWCVPVLFGNDSESEVKARAYAIDDNALTIVGGEFTALDISKMYNEDLLDELRELADAQEFLIGFDGDDIDFLINLDSEGEDESTELIQEQRGRNVREAEDNYNSSDVRQMVLILSVGEYNDLIDKIDEIKTKIGINNNTECIQWLVENYVV